MDTSGTPANHAAKADAPALVSRAGHTLLITINRPQARNAIDTGVTEIIARTLDDADRDPTVRAIVLTGAGDIAFCAGADLKVLSRGERTMPQHLRAYGFAGIVRHPTAKPLIAAVNGHALGGGLEIVLACDLVISAKNARFGLPEVTRGRIAGAGGAFRLAEQIGRKRAMQMILTGDPIDSRTALEWGLVNALSQSADLVPSALRLGQKIATNGPLAVASSKRVAEGLAGGRRPREDRFWASTEAEVGGIRATRDAQEGAIAFAERRSPHWHGE